MSMKRRLLPVAALVALALPATAAVAAAPTVHTIGVGSNPIDIAISAARSQAYVANDGSVSVVNLKTNTQTAEISTGVNHGQTAIGSFQNGAKVYIGDFANTTMVAFNPKTQAVTPNIKVGGGATDIVNPSNGFAYVTTFAAQGAKGRVQVVNVASNKLTRSIPLNQGAGTATPLPGTRYIWVGSVISGRIWVVNTRTDAVVNRFMAPKSGPVAGIAFSPDNKQAWVSGIGGVTVLDRASGKVLAFIPITNIFSGGPNAGPIAFNKAGTQVLIVDSTDPGNPGPGTVAAINAKTRKVTQRIAVGTEPTGMGLDYARGMTYTTNYQDDTLSYFATP
jgi:DNA-binding beta-propeller fold protein YncE